MMRIITGAARGTQLVTLEGEATRPTAERVKEAVFSAIQFDVAEARFLDLFAGSGQMGLEAVSRGASLAVLADASADAIAIIKENAKKTRLFDRCRIVNYAYAEYLKGYARTGEPSFDIVYIDPPFAEKMYAVVLKRLAASGALDVHTKVIVESETPDIFGSDNETEALYTVTKSAKYGRIYITYLYLKAKEE